MVVTGYRQSADIGLLWNCRLQSQATFSSLQERFLPHGVHFFEITLTLRLFSEFHAASVEINFGL